VRRAAKVDQNQEQIVTALRGYGASVQSLAPIGNGCPDLLVAKGGRMYLMEVKRGKAEPNELQKRWHIEWRSEVHVVRSVDEALSVIREDA
jgi:hypothetical protein